jgi:hypothetical protein
MTNEDKINVFHAYHNAKVKTQYKVCAFGRNTNEYHISKILCIHENGNIQFSHALFNQDYFNIDNCQLLLYSLSDISDEDYEVAYLMQCKLLDETPLTSTKNGFKEFILSEKGYVVSCTVGDYLRSKGYNLGYANFSPDDLVNEGVVKIIKK